MCVCVCVYVDKGVTRRTRYNVIHGNNSSADVNAFGASVKFRLSSSMREKFIISRESGWIPDPIANVFTVSLDLHSAHERMRARAQHAIL